MRCCTLFFYRVLRNVDRPAFSLSFFFTFYVCVRDVCFSTHFFVVPGTWYRYREEILINESETKKKTHTLLHTQPGDRVSSRTVTRQQKRKSAPGERRTRLDTSDPRIAFGSPSDSVSWLPSFSFSRIVLYYCM